VPLGVGLVPESWLLLIHCLEGCSAETDLRFCLLRLEAILPAVQPPLAPWICIGRGYRPHLEAHPIQATQEAWRREGCLAHCCHSLLEVTYRSSVSAWDVQATACCDSPDLFVDFRVLHSDTGPYLCGSRYSWEFHSVFWFITMCPLPILRLIVGLPPHGGDAAFPSSLQPV